MVLSKGKELALEWVYFRLRAVDSGNQMSAHPVGSVLEAFGVENERTDATKKQNTYLSILSTALLAHFARHGW